jgi:hypothetical protein
MAILLSSLYLFLLSGYDLSNVYFDQFCGDRINLSDAKLINAQFFQSVFVNECQAIFSFHRVWFLVNRLSINRIMTT